LSVYGPCHGELRDDFIQWLFNLNIPDDELWLIMGDFNFIRSQDNRNLPGGDMNAIFLFNELISHLGLLELPLKDRSYTWSNMQQNPPLVQLDWFFSTPNWTSVYPNIVVIPLAKPTSDHVPCVVTIDTVIPHANIFRFENYWVEQQGFMECVSATWDLDCWGNNSTSWLSRKLKILRGALKQ
jgi:hypothetical protein